jgi:hypothetical protein
VAAQKVEERWDEKAMEASTNMAALRADMGLNC